MNSTYHKPITITLELSENQAAMLRYACDEMANRRLEQAIDNPQLINFSASARRECNAYRELADKVGDAIREGK